MVFNATFNNISVISCRSVLLVEEAEYPEKTTDLTNFITPKKDIVAKFDIFTKYKKNVPEAKILTNNDDILESY